jgi:hypothetical protein
MMRIGFLYDKWSQKRGSRAIITIEVANGKARITSTKDVIDK